MFVQNELKGVERFCSYTTDVGARFYLALAEAARTCGHEAEAKRIWARVMADAESSSQRWAAEQALLQRCGGWRTDGRAPVGLRSADPCSMHLALQRGRELHALVGQFEADVARGAHADRGWGRRN